MPFRVTSTSCAAWGWQAKWEAAGSAGRMFGACYATWVSGQPCASRTAFLMNCRLETNDPEAFDLARNVTFSVIAVGKLEEARGCTAGWCLPACRAPLAVGHILEPTIDSARWPMYSVTAAECGCTHATYGLHGRCAVGGALGTPDASTKSPLDSRKRAKTHLTGKGPPLDL